MPPNIVSLDQIPAPGLDRLNLLELVILKKTEVIASQIFYRTRYTAGWNVRLFRTKSVKSGGVILIAPNFLGTQWAFQTVLAIDDYGQKH